MQIPGLSIFFMFLTAVLSIGTPVALFLIFRRKYRAPLVPLLLGAAAFIIFAMVLEGAVHRIVLINTVVRNTPALYVLYGTLMAGLFEETARFIVFHSIKKRYHDFGAALAYGVGHGGVESIILAGLAMINNLVIALTVNSGSVGTLTAGLSGAALDQANAQIAVLASTAPSLFLLSGIERLLAITLHLALSVMVFYAVFGRTPAGKSRWPLYPAAILLHALVDVPAALTQAGVLHGVVLVEALVGAGALLSVVIARLVHKACAPGIALPSA